MPLKYEQSEQKEIRQTQESWHGEANGWDFRITRDSDRGVRIGAMPIGFRPEGKIMLFDCHPKHVDDLERFAEVMPDIFRAIAKEMREAGLIDLRSTWDAHDDQVKEWRKKLDEHQPGTPLPEYPKY